MPDECPFCKTPLVEDSKFCHACGAPLTGQQPQIVGKSKVAAIRASMLLACIAWVLGWLGTLADAEAMTGLGGISTILGLVMIFIGLAARYRRAVLVGIVHCAMFGLLVALIGVTGWSPSEAQYPFLWIGAVYVGTIIPLSVHAWRGAPPTHHPFECRKCGYLLYGLTEPRCPECGTPFEPPKR